MFGIVAAVSVVTLLLAIGRHREAIIFGALLPILFKFFISDTQNIGSNSALKVNVPAEYLESVNQHGIFAIITGSTSGILFSSYI